MPSGSTLGAFDDRRRSRRPDPGRRPVRRWLAALPPAVGLPLLFALGMGPARSGIETSLETRTQRALVAAGWAGLEARADGRDLTVTGSLADAAQMAEVQRIVEGVGGVRRAALSLSTVTGPGGRGGLTIGLLNGVDVDVRRAGGKLVLRGDVASEETRRALVSAAADTAGPDAVLDQLTLGGDLPQPQPAVDARAQASLRTLLAAFAAGAASGTILHLGPDELTLQGSVGTTEARNALGDAALAAAGPGVGVRNELTAEDAAPGAKPPEDAATSTPPLTAPPTQPTATAPTVTQPTATQPTATTSSTTAPATTAAPASTVVVTPPITAPPPAPQHFTLYFASESTTPDGASQAVLAQAVAAAQAAPADTTVTVTGYADPYGDAAYNLSLSRRRAEVVADTLRGAASQLSYAVTAQGVDGSVGESDSSSGRRVDITIG